MKGHILIIEDERIVAENLAATFRQHLDASSHIVDNQVDAVLYHSENHIDLIVSDINLYGHSIGAAIVQRLLEIRDVPVIYLTAYSEDQELKAALDTNPVAYVLKPYLERQLLVAVKMALTASGPSENAPKPTQRELEIIQLIAEGLSSRKIADRLFISEHTVSTHRKNILKRFHMDSTGELVAFAIKNKWIKV
jgi:DNA-binding NarL/FixJ family response regulator